MRRIQVKDLDCAVNVIIKRSNRHIYLRVRENMLWITSPASLSDEFIKDMILKNYDMIVKALCIPPSESGRLHFFGKDYPLEIIGSAFNLVEPLQDKIIIHTKKKENSHIQKLVSLFYAKELSKFVEKNLPPIKSAFHLNEEITFAYKNVKTYFGECFPKRRHIILATKLAKYEPGYILSVIYHEMAHFYYQNHSMQFYSLLEQVYPNYRQVQKSLRKIKYNDMF